MLMTLCSDISRSTNEASGRNNSTNSSRIVAAHPLSLKNVAGKDKDSQNIQTSQKKNNIILIVGM